MNLRLKFILYLVLIHLLFAGVSVYLLSKYRIWLLAVEAVFVISLLIGVKLVRDLFGTLELIRTGAEFIQDSDFTSRFREVGQPEIDQLVRVYNRMVDNLREERTRMQEQNFFLDKVLTASPSGIITLDFDGRITMLNPAAERMLTAKGPELIGRKPVELNSPFIQSLNEVRLEKSEILPLSGRRRVKCQRSRFLDRGFTRDFVLMEELTEELRQTEKTAYEKVIRLMSHEVNNTVGSSNSLLHSCLHYADQLRSEDRADFENAVRVVIGRTDQLNSFMRNFADVFRLPSLNIQEYDLIGLLQDVTILFKIEIEKRNIELKWETQNNREMVNLDRGQMEQVLVNILKNSIEAIGEDGVITFRIGRDGKNPFLIVEDSGGGFTASVRANLFTPFFSTKGNGQGIGLTLVQEILDAHGFDFSLESESGKPTCFTIYFSQGRENAK